MYVCYLLVNVQEIRIQPYFCVKQGDYLFPLFPKGPVCLIYFWLHGRLYEIVIFNLSICQMFFQKLLVHLWRVINSVLILENVISLGWWQLRCVTFPCLFEEGVKWPNPFCVIEASQYSFPRPPKRWGCSSLWPTHSWGSCVQIWKSEEATKLRLIECNHLGLRP